MASQESKGSILFKIIIVVLIVAIYFVIVIPGQIWDREQSNMKISRQNMLTLFEAHSYFHRLKNTYTNNIDVLLTTIKNDSTLQLRNNIVNRTLRLRNAMETFLNVPIVYNTNRISVNLKNVQDDLISNERYFRSQNPQVLQNKIFDRSEDLKVRMSTSRSGTGYENFQTVVVVLDSLWQLRRDLVDYSLQSAARRASNLAEAISKDIISIDFRAMSRNWLPLQNDLTALMNSVNSIEKLRSLTTIADRVADFQDQINGGFDIINSTSSASNAQQLTQAVSELNRVYQEFLSDFLVTEQFCQYALTETDSLLLSFNEKNLYTPGYHQSYLVTFMDTLGLQVEDPTLLDGLKRQAQEYTAPIAALPFLSSFAEYDVTLDSLKNYYALIKTAYRRNLDITIMTKELDDLLPKVKTTLAFESYKSLQSYSNDIPSTISYYTIRKEVEQSLISVGNFKQIYGEKIFGNLDSLHVQIIRRLNEFQNLLAQTRGNSYSMNTYITQLSQSLEKIKSVPATTVQPSLEKLEDGLQEVFLFASKGKEERVYGIFTTEVVNHGKVSGRSAHKSWEEKTEE